MRVFARGRIAGVAFCVAAACLASVGYAAAPAGAVTNLNWSGPLDLAQPQAGLGYIACPASNQCTTTIGGSNNTMDEMTFNPVSPGTPVGVSIGTGISLGPISCPSTTQCTAVGEDLASGQAAEVTFNPQNPSVAEERTYAFGGLGAVACLTTGDCTALAANGYEVTFYPALPGDPIPVNDPSWALIDPTHQLNAIACPATQQCTAVDNFGQALTFSPNDNQNDGNNPSGITSNVELDPGQDLVAIACPSPGVCVAVDRAGQANSFDPGAFVDGTLSMIDAGYPPLTGVSCVSTTECIAVDEVGHAIVGNPLDPTTGWTVTSAVGPQSFLNLIGCGSAPTCSGYDAFLNQVVCTPDSVCVAMSSEGGQAWVASPPVQTTVLVKIDGASEYGTTPTFGDVPNPTYSSEDRVVGTPSCSTVNNPPVALSSTLPVGTYSINVSTCSGLSMTGPTASSYNIVYTDGGYTVVPGYTKLVATPATVNLNTITFSATLSGRTYGQPVPNEKVSFAISGSTICSAITDPSGIATCGGSDLSIGVGAGTYTASFAGDSNYLSSSTTASEPGLSAGLLAGLLGALVGLLKGI